jgi:hypothetical protein
MILLLPSTTSKLPLVLDQGQDQGQGQGQERGKPTSVVFDALTKPNLT